jgi:integrase
MAFRTQRDLDRLALPAGKIEVFHFDTRCPGLSVRIQRTGKPAFVAWFTAPGGKRKRITIGAVAGIDLDQARRQATEIVNAARDGRDPGQERKLARIAAADVLTLADMIDAYLREHAKRHQRPRTLAETTRALEKHWLPLHGRPAADVTRQDISARLIELARSTGAVGANRARAHLSAAYGWAMRAGLLSQLDVNPTINTIRTEETSRERVLTPAELSAIWKATADLSSYDASVRLLMLTGARRAEVGGMAHAEIDRDRRLWVLPGARTKNRREHEVPLSRQAWAIVTEFPELPKRPFVFGRRGRAPFSGWSQCKVRLDERIARRRAEQRLGRSLKDGEQPEPGDRLAPWRAHDLRRTFATLAADHELIEPHIIEAILNHASGHQNGVAGVYNRAAYREPKRLGLQVWADWLEAAVEGREAASNVVALAG